MDSIWNLWNYVEYVESTWNLWGSVKYTSDPAKKLSGLHSVKSSPVSGFFPDFENGPCTTQLF